MEWVLGYTFDPRCWHECVILGNDGTKEVLFGAFSCGKDSIGAVDGEVRHTVSDACCHVVPTAEFLHQDNVCLIGRCR